MKSGAAPSGGGEARPRRRFTHAETIRRQQRIVQLREVERRTFAEIAAELGMGEKEVRQTHRRYVEEIAPLLTAAPADVKAGELLRELDDIRQLQRRIAATSKNDNARVGALRDATRTIEQEFAMRRALGLMPKVVGDGELTALADAIVAALERHRVDDAAVAEIEERSAGVAEASDDGEKTKERIGELRDRRRSGRFRRLRRDTPRRAPAGSRQARGDV